MNISFSTRWSPSGARVVYPAKS